VLSGELVVPGYRFEPLIGTDWIAEQPDGWMRRLVRLSSDLGVASFVSHPEREAATGKLFNSLFVIGRNGQILGRHRKLDPTPGSEDWSSAGEPGRPISVDGITIGLLVCADAYSALPALRLRDAGAQLLVSSAAWVAFIGQPCTNRGRSSVRSQMHWTVLADPSVGIPKPVLVAAVRWVF
jgi:predicted amidohydrolase